MNQSQEISAPPQSRLACCPSSAPPLAWRPLVEFPRGSEKYQQGVPKRHSLGSSIICLLILSRDESFCVFYGYGRQSEEKEKSFAGL